MARTRLVMVIDGLPEADRNSYTLTTGETTTSAAKSFAELVVNYARILARKPQRTLEPGAPWWTKGIR